MTHLAVALAVVAVVLGALGPLLLRRLDLQRVPRSGVALWLAASIAAVVAAALSLVALGAPTGSDERGFAAAMASCLDAASHAYGSPSAHRRAAVLGVVLAVFGVRLVTTVAANALRTRRVRARHVDMLRLTARQMDGVPDAVLVEDPDPLAYCVPGRRSTIVVTTGAVAALDPQELRAVLAHERAHLRGKHAWVVSVVQALADAVPLVPVFQHARVEVASLLEMLADDQAGSRYGRTVVASALVRLGRVVPPAGVMGVSGSFTGARVRRLLSGAPRVSAAVRGASYAAASVVAMSPLAAVALAC
jgi:Zn-dependent protease with chaperone function